MVALKRPASALSASSVPGPSHASGGKRARTGTFDYAADIISRMSADDLKTLKSNLKELGVLRIASACSGSNIATVAAQALVAAAGVGKVEEIFACETNKYKRRFCKFMEPPGSDSHSFLDIANISDAAALCERHGSNGKPAECAIPKGAQGAFIFTRGFSCKNLSKAFPPVEGVSRSQYVANLLEKEVGTSGATCAALFKFMGSVRPPFVIFENVAELLEAAGGSNMNYFVNVVRKMGYEIAVRIFTATDFYMPQARRRVFGICCDVEAVGLSSDDAKLMLESMMELTGSFSSRAKMIPLEKFLLSDTDGYVQAETARLMTVKDKGLEATDPQDMSWRPVFLDMCRKKGWTWDEGTKLPEPFDSSEALKVLCKRQRSVLAFYLTENPELCALDVQPSLPRMSIARDNHLLTIMPSSRYILVSRRRILMGLEALKIVGFPEKKLKEYAAAASASTGSDKHVEVDPFYMDLAGNAWSGPLIFALFVSVLTRCSASHLFFAKGAVPREGCEDIFQDILSM